MRRRSSCTTCGGSRPRLAAAPTVAVCSACLAAMLAKVSTRRRSLRYSHNTAAAPAASTTSPATTPAASAALAHSAICHSMLASSHPPGQKLARTAQVVG